MAGGGPERVRRLDDVLAGVPPVWPEPLLPRIRRRARDRTLIVLDDDPTAVGR